MKLSRIAGSLKYGDVIGKMGVFAFLMMFSVFLAGIFLMIFIINDGPDMNFLDIGGVIVAFVAMPALFITALVFLIKCNRQRKEILAWLNDAVELKAYSKKIGSSWDATVILSYVKIQVMFSFNGEKYSKISENKAVGTEHGYDKTWVKYADKEIKILYSPKYDQVLVLKDIKHKKSNNCDGNGME